MELAALPGHAWKAAHEGLAQAWVIVADDEGDPVQAALLERVEESTPVDVGFGERGADAEDGAGAASIDGDGAQDRAVEDGAIAAHLFIAGIEDEMRMRQRVQRPVTPDLQLLIELCGGAADLHGGDFQSAGELRENGADAAGGDALHVHLRDGKGQGAFTAQAALQGGRIEVHLPADLRNGNGDLAEAGLQRLRHEPVGVALARRGALVGSGAEDLRTFGFHGEIEEQADGLREAFSALG